MLVPDLRFTSCSTAAMRTVPLQPFMHGRIMSRSNLHHVLYQWRKRSDAATASPPLGDETVTYLRNSRNNAEVYLIGTAHVSEESAQEVLQVIEKVKPGTIVVELCRARADRILMDKQDGGVPFSLRNPVEMFLASLYAYFRLLGREPGKEFKVALQEAKKLNAKVVLADQDVHITARKLQQALLAALRSHPSLLAALAFGFVRAAASGLRTVISPFSWRKSAREQGPEGTWRAQGADILKQVEEMKSRKTIREIERELHALSPQLVDVAIHERDLIMLEHLLKCEGKVVAVVGLAHMDGIERGWHAANR